MYGYIVRCLSLALFALLLNACSGERPAVANEEPAPDFTLDRLDGGTAELADFRGSVIALRFWADWCPFCRREMRELEPLYLQLRDRGLVILAVNVGQDRSRVERFVERAGYSYPTLLDPDSTVARRYGVVAIPVTYFIDRDGVVRGRILGESDAASFERMAAPLLAAAESVPRPEPISRDGMGKPPAERREYFPPVVCRTWAAPTAPVGIAVHVPTPSPRPALVMIAPSAWRLAFGRPGSLQVRG